MKRRSFLKNTTALSLPIFVNGIPLHGMSMPSAFTGMNGDSDRVLVLIQLNGGNDGLNTIIPLDSYDNLANLRSNIMLPENSLIQITGDNAFHPAFTGMADLFDNAKLNIVQNVGYPNQNRSHFRSTDIWQTASEADEYLSTGWVGRYFESKFPGYPQDYPNADCPDPFAMTIGAVVSETCQGISGNFSVAVNNPNDLFELPVGAQGNYDPASCYGKQVDFVRLTIKQTNAYADRITEAYNAGTTQATYPQDNGLANQLRTVASLIKGGLQTRVYIVSQGGYDTHANQTEGGDPLLGFHTQLLTNLSEAVSAFQNDIELMGIQERVIGMTFSEFGRQIRSNDGVGTDHGDAAPLMVFGNCVNPGIIGDNPDIPAQVDVQTGLPMQYDFRSVYGSILMDWFEVPEAEVKDMLFDEFQYLPILKTCDSVDTYEPPAQELSINVYPNPFMEWLTIEFGTENEWAKVSLFDARGQELRVLASRKFSEGEHTVKLEARDLAAGNYFIRIQTEKQVKTKSIIRVR
ncbi:MAG: DUF1501 domain-containing protein [Saprospiraceae bacterium]|nr:DUF1501 domain-containing protein [Saprospiraceae bacterium]